MHDDIDLICALTGLCEALFNFDALLQVGRRRGAARRGGRAAAAAQVKALVGVKMPTRQHVQLARVRVRAQLRAGRTK